MRRAGISGAIFLLAVASAAQAPAPAGAKPPDKTELFAAVRAAIVAGPPLAAPDEWVQLGGIEGQAAARHDAAVGDFATGFNAARRLAPPPAGDAAEATARRKVAGVKAAAERDAIRGLLEVHEFDRALDLARNADVKRAPLYDALIAAGADPGMERCAGMRGMVAGGVAVMAYPTFDQMLECTASLPGGMPGAAVPVPDYDAMALARECAAADGSFPYLGLWLALETRGPHTPGADELVREIYTHAGDDPHLDAQAVSVLGYTRVAAPGLDAQLEDAVIAALQRLASQPGAGATDASGLAAGRNLLALLTSLDAPRASTLAAEMPAFGGGAVTLPDPPAQVAPPDPAALLQSGLAPPASTQQAVQQVRVLMNAARQFNAASHERGVVAATAAEKLLNDDVFAAGFPDAMLLADAENRLGMRAAALALMYRCLDFVDRKNVALDHAYVAMSDEERSNYAPRGGDGAFADLVYNAAARLDFDLALRRAETSPAVVQKADMLLAVAAFP